MRRAPSFIGKRTSPPGCSDGVPTPRSRSMASAFRLVEEDLVAGLTSTDHHLQTLTPVLCVLDPDSCRLNRLFLTRIGPNPWSSTTIFQVPLKMTSSTSCPVFM